MRVLASQTHGVGLSLRTGLRGRASLLVLAGLALALALIVVAGPRLTAGAAAPILYLEAEGGVVQSPMAAVSDEGASACAYVASPSGNVGTTTLTFTVTEAGNYWFWGRVRSFHEGDNSFFVSVNNGPEWRWDFPVNPLWSWQSVKDAALGSAKFVSLPAGAHTIRFRAREMNSSLDAVAVSSDRLASPSYVGPCGPTATPTITSAPSETFTPTATNTAGPSPTPTETSVVLPTATRTATATVSQTDGLVYVEAEGGVVQSPMAAVSEEGASACAYVASPSGNVGTTTLTFTVTEAGNYWFWGRVRSFHEGDNSFFVSVNNGPEWRWDFPVNPLWSWQSVKDAALGSAKFVSLPAGAHTIRFRTREMNSSLDAVAIGNNRLANPTYVQPCGPTPTPTQTLPPAATATPTATNTVGPSPTPTETQTAGPSATATATPTETSVVIATATSTPSATRTASSTPSRTHTPTTSPNLVFLEAEAGALVAPMVVISDPNASSCQFVASSSGSVGSVTVTFVAPEPATYYLWGRTRADYHGMNSLFVSVDGGTETRWDFPLSVNWTWQQVKDVYTGRRMAYFMAAGPHQITFRTRSANSPLDVVAVTLDAAATPSYVAGCGTATPTPTPTHTGSPTNTRTPTQTPTVTATATIGPSPTPTSTALVAPSPTPWGVIHIEPEDSQILEAPMVVADDNGASRCTYVYTPKGRDAAGYFVMPIEVSMAGNYHIWVRARAPDSGSNAMFVSIDAEPEFQWIIPVTPNWSWVRVTNADAGGVIPRYSLSVGVHWIWMRTLESGTQIDAVEFVFLGPGQTYTPGLVSLCGTATPTPTRTPTFTVTPTPTNVPYTQTIVLQKGVNNYAGVSDTSIYFNSPDLNQGASSSLYLEGRDLTQMLIRYDLSALPSSARVVSATLGVYVIPDPSFTRRQPFTSTVYAALKPWTEMGATWMQAAPGLPWAVPGAYDPGGDYQPWPNDEIWFYYGTPQAEYTERWFTYTVTSLVQSWIENPASNHGFIVKGHWPHTIFYQIRSSDYWAPDFRPRLRIQYYPNP